MSNPTLPLASAKGLLYILYSTKLLTPTMMSKGGRVDHSTNTFFDPARSNNAFVLYPTHNVTSQDRGNTHRNTITNSVPRKIGKHSQKYHHKLSLSDAYFWLWGLTYLRAIFASKRTLERNNFDMIEDSRRSTFELAQKHGLSTQGGSMTSHGLQAGPDTNSPCPR